MVLFPVTVIHVKDPDILIFADHRFRDCATAYRLRANHSDRQILEIAMRGNQTRERFVDAHHDLQAYINYIGQDPTLTDEARRNKRGVFSAVATMIDDCLHSENLLQGGIQIDPVTLKPSYWLIVRGFQQDEIHELVPLNRAFKELA